MQLGDVIASFRRRKRIDQKGMAAQLGISVSYLSQIENSNKMPSGKLLNKISEVLGIPVTTLLFETMDKSSFNDPEIQELFNRAKPIMDEMINILLAE
ncbi:Transcriptional regulator, contains XRE-family HTH domain [Cnuella takakiae]|uniref:Transcriptional regulator, contains XRE-family HTH domain n=1 Tax=Cnuella takakiae TaxID=1302690 RepID=A0A1M5EJZ7_9BACT|nr:helix-turn-helix transcriptional regulator [Cnuella takakiae]OLY91206.1 hypothetical protein BUE76_04300 [Cnuella takakiae]SHF79623.1 Transcriptional regulator, contains XRE-family HTH domain [Cnuella takakiae]